MPCKQSQKNYGQDAYRENRCLYIKKKKNKIADSNQQRKKLTCKQHKKALRDKSDNFSVCLWMFNESSFEFDEFLEENIQDPKGKKKKESGNMKLNYLSVNVRVRFEFHECRVSRFAWKIYTNLDSVVQW